MKDCSQNQGQLTVAGSWSPLSRPMGRAMQCHRGEWILQALTGPISLSLVSTLWTSSEAVLCCPLTQLQGPTSEALPCSPLPLAGMHLSSELWLITDLDSGSTHCLLVPLMYSSFQDTLCFYLEGSLPSFPLWPQLFFCLFVFL